MWQAYASSALDHVRIKAHLAQTGFDGMVTVAAFEGRGRFGGRNRARPRT